MGVVMLIIVKQCVVAFYSCDESLVVVAAL
jgi:hypothetical protein